MEILVIGGSYFLGRHFVECARDEAGITVFNRGTHPLKLSGVNEISGDRHDKEALKSIPLRRYDSVVDFCAYEKGDIEFVFENLKAGFDQYIFISTCDVYRRGLNRPLDESAPFESRDFCGEAGSYILGKAALEKELEQCSIKYQKAFTSIRPAFIYGPYNYAPREGIYFHWIKNAGQIIHPYDATGQFQLVYVKDAARAIMAAAGNERSYNRAYNLAPLPMITYDMFADALEEAIDIPFTKATISVEAVNEKQIPLPFPLTKEESNYYDGQKALELIGNYTSLAEGLRETAEWINES